MNGFSVKTCFWTLIAVFLRFPMYGKKFTSDKERLNYIIN